MAEDELGTANGESNPPSFDFDEEAISNLLDTFVETQTGSQAKRVSRPPKPSDSGALAAQRTVFQHASRHEDLPLVGDTAETKARRIELLMSLAERAAGSARARLLTSAAELHEQLGDNASAATVYGRALSADARDVVVLRALRRLAMARQDWAAAADALERESGLELSTAERSSALKLLASIFLSKLGDPAAAEQAAEHAAELRGDDFSADALIASARLARGDDAGAAQALLSAAEHWPQVEARSHIFEHAAALFERAGSLESAQDAYQRVLSVDPGDLAAGLGRIRTARGQGDQAGASEAFKASADGASTPLASALRRALAGACIADSSSEPLRAQLGDADDAPSVWTLAESAAFAGDADKAIAALQSDAANPSPEAAAIVAARRARLHAERGEEAQFVEAQRACLSEPRLNAYLQAWRRFLGASADDGSEVRQLLETVSKEGAGASVAMLRADDAARSRDGASFFAELEREFEESTQAVATGAALALAEVADEAGAESDRLAALLSAEARAPGSALLRRSLLLLDEDPESSARRWVREASELTGEQSAFALMMAARLSPAGTEPAIQACEDALSRQSDYWPALWALEDEIGSTEARAASALAAARLDPARRISASLRASMWTASASKRLAHAQEGLNRTTPDPLLLEQLSEAAGNDSEVAGDLLALAARQLGQVSYFERAAASYRAAGAPGRAAKALRDACEAYPEDLSIRVQRKDAELQALEFARLADAAMRRARAADDEAEELGAFAAMAEVDRFARRDMQSARLSLQSIAEARPAHLPTARALEWDALRENDAERIGSSARRLQDALPRDSVDRLARSRLLLELLNTDPGTLQADRDRWLRGIDHSLQADPGLARQVLGAAYARGDSELSLRALMALGASLGDELERGALALDIARVLQRRGDTEQALEILEAAQEHPLAQEGKARLLHGAKQWEAAAAAYRDAASCAKDSHRGASLWREAACILEESLADETLAIDAWVSAARCDVRYLDVYRRLATLYKQHGRLDELAALTEQRIDAGADTPTLVGLLVDKARQRRERGDLEGVTEALQECLELDPNHFAALKELVDTHRAAEDWQGAAEALIRIARLNRSADEQTWAFSQLAEIYDVHLQDLPRAEASLRRVTQLAPTRVGALDRLASVLSRQHKFLEAARLLEELVSRAGNEVAERDYRIRLAGEVEAAGEPRQAELLLETLRAEQPTEIDVILAVADHYRRQGAAAAEAMHLNRAVSELRTAIDRDPGSEALWTTLVRVLQRRLGPGPASCAASAAIALGHPASLFEGDVTDRGEALGEPTVPFSNVVDRIVAPAGLPQTLRRLFALCEHSFDKVLPFDASAWRLRRPSAAQRALVEEAGAVAEALGISEPRLKITYIAPAACIPVSGDPPTLVIGGSLLELTTAAERIFLFARALKVASNHLAPALRARPEDLDATLLALLQGHEAGRAQKSESRQMQDLRKKLLKAVPRRWRDEVESLVLELRGNPGFTTRAVPFAISELGDRAALTLTGDVPSAVNALVKIAGHDLPASDKGRLTAIRETPEAWATIQFAISDTHFEARRQAGVDP